MKTTTEQLLVVGGISLPLDAIGGDACFMAKKHLRRLGILPQDAVFGVWRRSLDARKREDLRFVWSVAVSGSFTDDVFARARAQAYPSVTAVSPTILPSPTGEKRLEAPPVVVGSGPAGLFCAFFLARAGYCPVLLERGGNVSERTEAIHRFETEKILDTETNVQFGAGGAGTFSDGKLVTRVNDPLTALVFDTFVSFGAPEEIRLSAKPHIGTDLLCGVVDRMTEEIRALGGKVLYHTRMDRILTHGNRVIGVSTNRGELPAGVLITATGHSARDTYETMIADGFAMEAKPFSVGVRIEHLQADIDRALYGSFAGHPAIGHAEYHLSCDTDKRGVYSFCMCPGGFVMAAASEAEGVAVNGMSRHARDGQNANSAIAVSVSPADYGGTPAAAIAFQRKIERAAFTAGGGDYSVPLTTMGDFLNDKYGTEPTVVQPTYMGGASYRLADPASYLPAFAVQSLRGAMTRFERNIKGFSSPFALLSGAETRTSAPLRILRDPVSRTALGYSNLYPAGEGAGYAGGITSAALDGIHTAFAVMAEYRADSQDLSD